MRDKDGHVPLSDAIIGNYTEIVEELFKAGANVNIKNNKGDTLVIYAMHQNNTDMAKRLIERGSDINAKDYEGDTPLILCIEDIDDLITDMENMEEVHAQQSNMPNLIKRNKEFITFLINEGADVNAKNYNKHKTTALENTRDLEIAIQLIKAGANTKNARGMTKDIRDFISNYNSVLPLLTRKKLPLDIIRTIYTRVREIK